MKQNRREFLNKSALVSGALLLSRLEFFAQGQTNAGTSPRYGIQLYSLRDIISKDPFGLIQKLKLAGYTSIESYEGAQGVYWGKKPKEFAAYLKDTGLTMPSIHCNVFQAFDRKVAEAAEAGVKYVICPWLGPQKTLDDFKKAAATFNEMGTVCHKNDLRFAYHNHDYSFKPQEGKIPQAVLLEYTDPKLVDFEMDIYWAVSAGADPVEWFERYPKRFRLAHVKDRSKKPVADNGLNSVVVGTGSIDFETILKAGRAKGLTQLIVEQEANYGAGPLESAAASIKYLKEKRF